MHLGMGDGAALPPCNTITLPAGFVGPVNCDNSAGGPNYSVSATQFYNLAGEVQNLAAAAQQPTTTDNTGTILLVGAGLLLAILMMGGHR